MKERPILFSGPMVRALMREEDPKTKTRRMVKPQPHADCGPIEVGRYHPTVIDRHGDEQPGAEIFGAFSLDGEWGAKCPYGEPGDRLWVRETFITGHDTDGNGNLLAWDAEGNALPEKVWYRATDRVDEWLTPDSDFPTERVPWKPSIHMPRWASRITLELTGVRVERLQDISGADALAEGVQIPVSAPGRPLLRMSSRVPFGAVSPKHPREWGWEEYARFEFLHLFYDINKRAPVDANPWVWCLTFRRLEAGA